MLSSDQLPRMELTNTVIPHKVFTSCSQLYTFGALGYLWVVHSAGRAAWSWSSSTQLVGHTKQFQYQAHGFGRAAPHLSEIPLLKNLVIKNTSDPWAFSRGEKLVAETVGRMHFHFNHLLIFPFFSLDKPNFHHNNCSVNFKWSEGLQIWLVW